MLHVDAYDLPEGRRICRVPGVTSVSWSHSWNDKGSMSVGVIASQAPERLDLDGLLVEQRTMLALRDGRRILHAGPILTSPEWDPSSGTVKISCGGGWNLFDWRLVLDTRLRDRMLDGELVVDEDNPGYEWIVGYGGSGGDIIRSLITLAKAWGALPVAAPSGYGQTVGAPLSLKWNGWDFKTVGSAFGDVLGLDRGGQLRFDPELLADGRLQWRARWNMDGIVDHRWKWNTCLPGQRVEFAGFAPGELGVANQIWLSGGRDEDRLLLYRADAVEDGWPLLQATDSGTADRSLASLHAMARTRLGSARRDRTWKLRCGAELDVRVGDHVDLRVDDDYVHDIDAMGRRTSTVIPLVVTDVAGDASSDWLDVQARQRADSVAGVRPGTGDPVGLISRRMRGMDSRLGTALNPLPGQVYSSLAKLRELRGK